METVSATTLYIPHALIVAAMIGAPLSWLLPSRRQPQWQSSFAVTFFGIGSLALLILFFGIWSSHIHGVDLHYFSLAGRIPYSDAGGHLVGSAEMSYAGRWPYLPTTRPLAAGFRDLVTAATGLNYEAMAILQLVLICGSTAFAAQMIARWLGTWAALAFVGLSLIAIRSFVAAPSTELGGMFWGALAAGYFADSMRARSFESALLGVLTLSIALATRAGAVGVLPAVVGWAWIAFRDRHGAITRLAMIVAVAAIPFAASEIMRSAYGAPGVPGNWNLALLVCGLSIGGDWMSCYEPINKLGITAADRGAYASALYQMAWSHISADPSVFAKSILRSLQKLAYYAPQLTMSGYRLSIQIPGWVWTTACIVLIPIGLRHHIRSAWEEKLFWLLVGLGLTASAAIVFEADGWRVMHATHPLWFMFIATGFATQPRSGLSPFGWRMHAAALSAGLLALMVAPAVLKPMSETLPPWAFSSKAITGFVVVKDGSRPLFSSELEITQFKQLIEYTRLDRELGSIVAPFAEAAEAGRPLALFWTYQEGDINQASWLYVGPASLLNGNDTKYWRFFFTEPHWKKPDAFVRVISAAIDDKGHITE